MPSAFIVGDQRAAADKGAAGVGGAGECERLVASFTTAAAADGVVRRAAGVQLQRGVIGERRHFPSASTLVATSVPPLIKGATGIEIGSEGNLTCRRRIFPHGPLPPMLLMKSPRCSVPTYGVVGDVAGTQRLNVSGVAFAAADDAAGCEVLLPESVGVSSPDFSTFTLPPMLLMKSPPLFGSSVALLVTSPVPSAYSRLSGNQRAAADKGVPSV